MTKKTLRPKDAATLLLYRRDGPDLRVLMGQRHGNHVFLPNAFVFPGGRVSPEDSRIAPATPLRPDVTERLERATTPARARALGVAAIRETFEETGLLIATGEPQGSGDGWHKGIGPELGDIDYFFRAITPPNRVRRFDTRFFMAEAGHLNGALGGDGELENLAWRTMEEIQGLPLAGITRIALAEFSRLLAGPPPEPQRGIPVSRHVRGRYSITLE